MPSLEANKQAKAAAQRAVELDETLPEARTSLARSQHLEWDWRNAEAEYKRAIQLDPNYATAHQLYSILLAEEGRLDEALTEAQVAHRLDPLSLPINRNLAQVYGYLHEDDKAVEQYRKTIELDPNFPSAHFGFGGILGLGGLLLSDGRYDEAFEELQQGAAASNDPETIQSMALASDVFRKSGVEKAIRVLVRAEVERSKQHYVSPYFVGWLYATIGEKDSAFYWLTKAYDMHEMSLALLKVDRWPDSVRSDPRYTALLHQIGLPQ